MLDLRFPTALQAMLSLALAREQGVARLSSGDLAEGLSANPSLVRKLTGQLAAHGLVTTTLGKSGGVALAKTPEAISLADIYVASTAGKSLWTARQDIPHRCVVSSNIESFFSDLASETDVAVKATLAKTTLAGALAELHTRDRRRGKPGRK